MRINQSFEKELAVATISILIHGAFIPVALSASVTTIAGAVSAESQNVPACYVKLANGEIRDLTKFCGFIKPQSCSGSLGSASRDLVLPDFCKQHNRCVLTKTCKETPRGIYTPPPGTPMGVILSKYISA